MKEEDLQFESEEMNALQEGTVNNFEDLLPIMDCPTRWSSTYFFLKRAILLKSPIDEITKEHDLRTNELYDDDWLLLQ